MDNIDYIDYIDIEAENCTQNFCRIQVKAFLSLESMNSPRYPESSKLPS